MKKYPIKDKSLAIQVDKKKVFKYPTSENLPALTQMIVAIACRGSGKNIFFQNLMRLYKADNNCDKIIVISPTFSSNRMLMDELSVTDDAVFDPEDKDVMEKLNEYLQKMADDYQQYINDLRDYEKTMYIIKQSSKDISNIDPYLLMKLNNNGFEKPTYEYSQEPRLHLLVDDCQSTSLFGNKKFLNLCIRNRHTPSYDKNFINIDGTKGGALQVSIYLLCQNFSAQHQGLPRSIRNNATSYAIWKCRDEKELENIYKSVSGECSFEEFMKIYNYCTNEKHSFMFIDLFPKKEHYKYRKNLNEYVSL